MSEKDEIALAAEAAWNRWHEDAGFMVDDDYIPAVSPVWGAAFVAGVEWAKAKGEK